MGEALLVNPRPMVRIVVAEDDFGGGVCSQGSGYIIYDFFT